MRTEDETRPDGRTPTDEILRLRFATRALRLHLDLLPVDYDEAVPPDSFLAGIAFALARNRYACAESMIGAGFGGTVIGSLARSTLADGLRWLWIARDPEQRRRRVLGDLLEERSRIARLLETDASTFTRWLMPIPPVADLTGASREWLDVDPMPNDDALLDELRSDQREQVSSTVDPVLAALIGRADEMLNFPGLRGAAMVLAHAGHGNYLGQRSTLTDDGVPGFDLRADHEAIFMHAAAVGVFGVLVGSSAALPETWPVEVDRVEFLTSAADLVADVAHAAEPMHRLGVKSKPGGAPPKSRGAQSHRPLEELVVVEDSDVQGELLDIEERLLLLTATFDSYVDRVRNSPQITTLPPDGTALHLVLTYGAALSNVQTVASMYEQPGAGVASALAARALLEEAARLRWRYDVQGEDELRARAKQYFDEYRFRQRRTMRTLSGHGIKTADAQRLFSLPPHVFTPPGVDEIAKGRVPVPTLASMLRSFGTGAEHPEWLESAYALLSQVTHATPLGYLHCLRYRDGWIAAPLSTEMLALTLDVSAIGSAYLISTVGLVLNDLSPSAKANVVPLRTAAFDVHFAARRIHGLDLPSMGWADGPSS